MKRSFTLLELLLVIVVITVLAGLRRAPRFTLADINLEFEEHSIIGLLGPNGAGKSTLLKMITALVWPAAGSVSIYGFDVHAEHEYAMKEVGAILKIF